MFGAVIRAAERWWAIKVTDFERRQMADLRQEIDHEYEARIGLGQKPSAVDDRENLSNNSRV